MSERDFALVVPEDRAVVGGADLVKTGHCTQIDIGDGDKIREFMEHPLQPHSEGKSPDTANSDVQNRTVTATITSRPLECVSLTTILDTFKSPIAEEQAWAIIYQFAAFYRETIGGRKRALLLSAHCKIETIKLHRDGSVHLSFSEKEHDDGNEAQDKETSCDFGSLGHHQTLLATIPHRKIIQNVAIIVYHGLDYSIKEDEERKVSPELQDLLLYMTAEDSEDDCIAESIDEGDKGLADKNNYGDTKCNAAKEVDHILEVCRNHVLYTMPGVHYKTVCCALIADTIELRSFSEFVLMNNGTDFQKSNIDLPKQGFNVWSRFWTQVIGEFHRGVCLKKSSHERAPTEFELTPYEVLMEDIRSKNYELRKVMVNDDISTRVKKDDHVSMCDLIKSRPPLKKASACKLSSPHEEIMDPISKGRMLKPSTAPQLPRFNDRLLSSSQITSSGANTVQQISAYSSPIAELRKVMVNGDNPPRMKKDDHALMCDLIKSRPPLKKVSQRKLFSPHEEIMDSIRKGRMLKQSTQMTSSDRTAVKQATCSSSGMAEAKAAAEKYTKRTTYGPRQASLDDYMTEDFEETHSMLPSGSESNTAADESTCTVGDRVDGAKGINISRSLSSLGSWTKQFFEKRYG